MANNSQSIPTKKLNEKLENNILNLNKVGISLLVPFIKEEVELASNNYTAQDGYHAALISMNLTIYVKLTRMLLEDADKPEEEKREISPTDESFLTSFSVILMEQETLLLKSFKQFSKLIKKYLEGEDSENFKSHIFKDFTNYKPL